MSPLGTSFFRKEKKLKMANLQDSAISSSKTNNSYLQDEDIQTDTTPVPTSTKTTLERFWGTVRFKNNDKLLDESHYMKVSAKTKTDGQISQLVKQIHEKWDLQKPSLIISVTGGAKDFNMKKKVSQKGRKNLKSVLKTTIKIKIKTIYPRGKGPTQELYSSSRRTAVVPLFKNYMQFFWLFFYQKQYTKNKFFSNLLFLKNISRLNCSLV